VIGRGRFFTDIQASIAIGSVLGDGHFAGRLRKGSYRLELCQGEKQLEYLLFKKEFFQDLILAPPRRTHSQTWQMSTRVVDTLYNWLPTLFDQQGQKIITPSLLAMLTDLSLAIFYLDDGYLFRRHSSAFVRLHMEDYGNESQHLLREWLQKRIGGHGIRLECGRYLQLNKDESAAFLRIVEPLIPKVMSWKHRRPEEAAFHPLPQRFRPMGNVAIKSVTEHKTECNLYRLVLEDADNVVANNMVLGCRQGKTLPTLLRGLK
jgi:hypothetical protein